MASVVISGDTSGSITLAAPAASGSTVLTLPTDSGTIITTASGIAVSATSLTTASGIAPSYSARAWVNFNGTGTVAIRGSSNVSSISDNGTGAYTINFIDAMPDINFTCVGTCSSAAGHGCASMMTNLRSGSGAVNTTTTQRVFTSTDSGASADEEYCNAVIFR
jgi:hypothetical protein